MSTRAQFIALLAAGLAPAAHAGSSSLTFTSVTIASTEQLGSYTGSMSWSYSAGSTGVLSIVLNNTSAVANGGYLTAFGLSKPATPGLTYSLTDSTHVAMSMFASGQDAAPFGRYDLGAGVGGRFLGGGNPSRGIAAGETGSFEFTIGGDAAALSSLAASSFFSGPNQWDFIARFRGFADGGSDKVPAFQGPQQTTIVPVPMPVALAAAGLVMLGVVRRRLSR